MYILDNGSLGNCKPLSLQDVGGEGGVVCEKVGVASKRVGVVGVAGIVFMEVGLFSA